MVKVDGEVEELRVGFERFRWCLGVSFFFFIGIDEYVVVFWDFVFYGVVLEVYESIEL